MDFKTVTKFEGFNVQKSKLILGIEEIIREEKTSKQDNYKSKC